METIICRPQNKSRNSEPMTAYFRQNVCCRKYKTPNRQMNHVNNNGSQKTMDPVEKYSLAFSLFDSRLLRKFFMRRKYFTQEYLVKKMAYVSTFPAMVIVHISTSHPESVTPLPLVFKAQSHSPNQFAPNHSNNHLLASSPALKQEG